MSQIYSDFHFHSSLSPDSTEALENQVAAALDRGIHYLCSTDHWDLVDDPHPLLSPPLTTWRETHLKVAQQFEKDPISLFFGIEEGEGFVRPQAVEDALQGMDFDFVISSVHAVDATDFAQGVGIYQALQGSHTEEEYRLFFQKYFQALLCQSQHRYYDTFAHINYPFRYLPPESSIKVEDYMEEITAVLENLLKNDRVFELNTTRGQTVAVWTPILKRYRELGGKHLTLGSDSHRKEDMSLGIKESVALLKTLGYDSYVYFEKRQRKEVPIL